MSPAGDLRHDATEGYVLLDRRADDAAQDVVATHHDRRGGLVAAGLDAEDDRRLVDRRAHGSGGHRCTVRMPLSGDSCTNRLAYSTESMSWHHMTIASST